MDILLGDKLALAQMAGISIDLSLVLPQSGAPTDLDWRVIFGKVLDNAIQGRSQNAGAPLGVYVRCMKNS